MPRRNSRTAVAGATGFTLIEVLFALALIATLLTMAIPLTAAAVESSRALAAAHHLEGRIMLARIEALSRSSSIALRFEPDGDDYAITVHVDGTGNGIRTVDIRRGLDPPIAVPERLRDKFAGVRFGLIEDVPDLDGRRGTGSDGVRIGGADLLALGPDGTATSGTLYLRNARDQYAIRILGVTGRTRLFRFDRGVHQWKPR